MNDNDDKLRHEVWKNFGKQQYVFLATTEGYQPRVRPVTLIHLQDKLFVATGSNDSKVKQIKENPKVEFCMLLEKEEEKGTIRAECIAKIVESKETKAAVYNEMSFLREFWGSPDDADYALIELQPTGFEYMKLGSMQAVKIKL